MASASIKQYYCSIFSSLFWAAFCLEDGEQTGWVVLRSKIVLYWRIFKVGKKLSFVLDTRTKFLANFLQIFFHFYFVVVAVVAVVADVAVVVVSVTVAVGHLQIFLIGRNFFFKLYFSIFWAELQPWGLIVNWI